MQQDKTTTLDDAATIDALRRLHATQRGSRDFYQEAARRATGDPIHTIFEDAARQREGHAAELAAYLTKYGTSEEQPVTARDRLRETWMKMRGLLNLGNHYVLLIEAERAEDRIKLIYQELLEASTGSAVAPLLRRQSEELQGIHHRVCRLRDRKKARR